MDTCALLGLTGFKILMIILSPNLQFLCAICFGIFLELKIEQSYCGAETISLLSEVTFWILLGQEK